MASKSVNNAIASATTPQTQENDKNNQNLWTCLCTNNQSPMEKQNEENKKYHQNLWTMTSHQQPIPKHKKWEVQSKYVNTPQHQQPIPNGKTKVENDKYNQKRWTMTSHQQPTRKHKKMRRTIKIGEQWRCTTANHQTWKHCGIKKNINAKTPNKK